MWCDRRVRRFTTRWTRFGGPCGNEEGYWPSRCAGLPRSLRVSLRSRLRLWHPVTLRITLPPSKVSLRGNRRIEIGFTAPREGSGWERSEMPSSDSSPRFARSSSQGTSCDETGLSTTCYPYDAPFGMTNGKRSIEIRILQPCYRDARARPIEPEILSCAGAVARYALTACAAGKATSICIVDRSAPRGTLPPFTR